MAPRSLLIGLFLLGASGPAWAADPAAPPAKDDAPASGAVLEPVDDDPFGDVFSATPADTATTTASPPSVAETPAETQTAAETPTMESLAPQVVPRTPELTGPPPGPATSEGLYLGPYVRLTGLVPNDDAFGAIAAFGALVGVEGGVEVAPFSGVEGLSFEAGLGLSLQTNTAFDAVQAQLAVLSGQASAVYRQPVFRALAVHARVTGAVNAAFLQLSADGDRADLQSVAASGSGGGAVGLSATFPMGRTLRDGGGRRVKSFFSLFAEAGYEAHSTLSFGGAGRQLEDTEPARIRVVDQPAGDLNLTGWRWRLGGAFRF